MHKKFRGTGSRGKCRFCGTSSNTGLLPIGYVCSNQGCQERAQNTCDKTLSCGHMCCGVKGEEKCLPCLHGCPSEAVGKLKQDADDMCMICYTEGLSCAPVIQVGGDMGHFWRRTDMLKSDLLICFILCSWVVAMCSTTTVAERL